MIIRLYNLTCCAAPIAIISGEMQLGNHAFAVIMPSFASVPVPIATRVVAMSLVGWLVGWRVISDQMVRDIVLDST